MGDASTIGKYLIVFGVVLAVLGLVVTLLPKFPVLHGLLSWLGKLPGDVYIRKENVSFYFPIVTCLLISIVLTLVFSFLKR